MMKPVVDRDYASDRRKLGHCKVSEGASCRFPTGKDMDDVQGRLGRDDRQGNDSGLVVRPVTVEADQS